MSNNYDIGIRSFLTTVASLTEQAQGLSSLMVHEQEKNATLEQRIQQLVQENQQLKKVNEDLTLQNRVIPEMDHKITRLEAENVTLAQKWNALSQFFSQHNQTHSPAAASATIVLEDTTTNKRQRSDEEGVNQLQESQPGEQKRAQTEKQHWEKKVSDLKKELEKNPNDPKLLFDLGYAYHKLKNFRFALERFKDSQRNGFITNWGYWFYVANAYFNLGKIEEAKYHIDLAIEKDKSVGMNYHLKAHILLKSGMSPEVRWNADQAKSLNFDTTNLEKQILKLSNSGASK